MSVSGREAPSDVLKWSGDPPGCSGVVGRSSRIYKSVLHALPYLWEWSGGPPEFPKVVGGLGDLREWSESPPRCPGVFVRAYRMSASFRESFPDIRE